MSLFGQLFSKKKELVGEEIASLLNTLSVLREPVILKTQTIKIVTDILAHDSKVFHLKNTLTRDEVLYELKGKNLQVLIPYELTLYSGDSRLLGLGMAGGVHTLKLMAPTTLVQQESRGAYRVSRFPEQPSVTFTTDNFDIVKCRLSDISMTGAGLRLDPRWERSNSKLTTRTTLIVDIRIGSDIRVSTTAVVRYSKGYRCGIEFSDLDKGVKDRLFKYVVDQRREEQRALVRIQQKPVAQVAEQEPTPVTEPVEKPQDKPTALLVGDHQKQLDFITAALTRKFELLYSTPSITDIRNHLDLRPNLCLIELKEENQEQVAQMRKASSLLPPGCVLMFYGRNFSTAFEHRFENFGYTPEMLINLHEAKKLLVFKQIQGYYSKRAPQ